MKISDRTFSPCDIGIIPINFHMNINDLAKILRNTKDCSRILDHNLI